MSDTTETETETETETDTTDEPSKAELHDRVKQLESTVEKLMPSRRDALRMGVAGLAGAAGLGAATQPADASTGSAGDIGDPSNRPDLFADTVDANELTGVSDLLATQVGQDSGNKQPLSVSIPNSSSFRQLVCIIKSFRNDGSAFLRFNGDSSGNSKYTHIDNSGNTVSGDDRFLLSDTSGFSRIAGTVVLTRTPAGVGIHNQISYSTNLSKIQKITHFGEYGPNSINQIELQQSRSGTNDASLTVFER